MTADGLPRDVSGRPTRLRDVDLERFFRPKTVAVIGATDSGRGPNTAMWRKIRAWGEQFGAKVHPVNPKYDTLDGVPCVATIGDVPDELDLAVILVGDSVAMFKQVLDKKPAFAVIFGAGFSEVGRSGEKLQQQLERLIESGETHLLGPNTNLNAFETFRDELDGPAITLITQSGHQGRPVFQSQDLGVKLSHWAPTGNESDLEFADFVQYFADLPDTGAIAAYIEGFKDGRTLMLAADHAAKVGVPLVCIKVGRTDEGASMAKSHTGHLTGSDRVTSDVFRQFGVTRVDGLDELTDVASTLARTRAPIRPGRRNVCVYAISGGTGAHMADLVAEAGMSLPRLGRLTCAELRRHIPGYLRVHNPVDSGGAPSADTMKGPKILDAILADPAVDLLIVPITGAVESMSVPFAQQLVAAAETTDKPILVVWGSPTEGRAFNEVLCSSSKLVTFRTFHNCVLAARSYFEHHEFKARYRSPFDRVPSRRSRAASGVAERLASGTSLSEHESKLVFAAYGIPVTRDVLCSSPDRAAKAARQMKGPVVMKIASPDIAHKSDLGLVRLGIDSGRDIREVFGKLVKRAAKHAPGARIDGVLVCETAKPGLECLVGVSYDELFGPTVTFGLGGVFVELFDDIATRVPPFDRTEARRMINQTRGSKLLVGARGQQAGDVSGVVDVIMKVQRLALDFADVIAEIDINPLVVRPDGVVALDGLIVTR
ncbi:MAG TPA: acetate--CoA ligase family protein [Microthrixaceae bacterium]|nr:acetate--CoA ligase family protein [Microthrixaceae bacterium]